MQTKRCRRPLPPSESRAPPLANSNVPASRNRVRQRVKVGEKDQEGEGEEVTPQITRGAVTREFMHAPLHVHAYKAENQEKSRANEGTACRARENPPSFPIPRKFTTVILSRMRLNGELGREKISLVEARILRFGASRR